MRTNEASAVSLPSAETQVVAYPETLVQRPDTHPMAHLADWMADRGFATSRIGYESDSYFFSPRALAALQSGLPDARFIDADLLVNWQRLVKSPAELEVMRKAMEELDQTAKAQGDTGAEQS